MGGYLRKYNGGCHANHPSLAQSDGEGWIETSLSRSIRLRGMVGWHGREMDIQILLLYDISGWCLPCGSGGLVEEPSVRVHCCCKMKR